MLIVAIAAINGSVFTGFKGNFRIRAALSANYGEHLPGRPVSVSAAAAAAVAISLLLPGPATLLTAPGLILKTTRCVKLLLTGCKCEILSTISTLERFILKTHWMTSSLKYLVRVRAIQYLREM